MQVSLGSACLVACLAIAVWGVASHWHEYGSTCLTSAEMAWLADRRAPFLVAGSILGSQSFASFGLMFILQTVPDVAETWGSRFQWTLRVYSMVSLAGAVMYIVKYLTTSHLVVRVEGVGEYLFTRSLHWLVSTPVQWCVFSQVCTKATQREMRGIYLLTLMTQVFGIIMLFEKEASMRWFCFLVSSCCFLESFRLGLCLKLHKEMRVVAGHLRWAMFGVWVCFPLVFALRWLNFISPWQEQVLLLCSLDVIAKSVTFSAMILSRVILSLARMNGTVQLVLSSHDVTIAVDDAWLVLDDPASDSVISMFFDEGAADSQRLIDLCINKEHQNRLIEAARIADSQHIGEPSPKAVVAFRLPSGGGETLVECLISKCLHGRRILGIAVASQVGNLNLGRTVPDSRADEGLDFGALSEGGSVQSTGTRNVDVQTRLALHNCNDVLQLHEPIRRMLNHLFLQSHTACALFAPEEAGTTPTIVVASPRLQALFFQASSAPPQPLTTVFRNSTVDRLLLALEAGEVILHHWCNVEAVSQMSFDVTMLPLTRMDVVNDEALGVQLCALVLTLADPPSGRPREPGYLRWTPVGCQLACDEGLPEKARSDAPPAILMPLVSAILESLR